MKRVTSLLILLFLLLSFCNAEPVFEYSTLSDGELYEMLESLVNEIQSRNLQTAFVLKTGVYVVGKHLLPGSYKVTYVDPVTKPPINIFGNPLGHIDTYLDSRSITGSKIINENIPINTSKYYIFDSGNVIDLQYGGYEFLFISD